MSRRIPFVTQLNNALANDCAWACAAMLIGAYTDTVPTIESLATRYGVPNKFTTIAQLMRCLNAEGVPVAYTAAANWEWYQTKWNEGVPVVSLLAMHAVSDNDGYPWAHFAIDTGVEDDRVTLYNPLKLNGPRPLPAADFRRGITERSRYVGGTNAPFQAVYPLTPLAAPVPSALARAWAGFDAIRGWAA